MMKTSKAAIFIASVILVTGSALSQTQQPGQFSPNSSMAEPNSPDTLAPVVQPIMENALTTMCGGVGYEEARYMKQAASDYDLMLIFATRRGEYLADVDVAIRDAKGNPVLTTTCDGPILLVDLPRSGVYRVQAKAGNITQNKIVHAKAKGRTNSLVMVWPRQPETMRNVAGTGRGQQNGSSGSSGNSDNSDNSDNMTETESNDNITQQPRH